MKKILALIGLVAVSAPTTLSVVACSHEHSLQPTNYSNIADAIRSLNVQTFARVDSKIDEVNSDIGSDIIIDLIKLKFDNSVNFVQDLVKGNFDIKKIINTKTNNILIDKDLKNPGQLKLKVIVTYQNQDITLNSSILNISSAKTDQEISDYIQKYDFSSLLQNSNFSPFIGVSLNNVKKYGSVFMGSLLGSYGSSYLKEDSFSIESLKKDDGQDITQNDLNTIATLNLTVAYKYNTVKSTVNVKVSLTKLDLNKVPNINNELDVHNVTNPKSLTSADVIIIIKAIKDWFNNITLTLYDKIFINEFNITGIEKTVKVGANFEYVKAVNFIVAANQDSKFFSGKTEQNLNISVEK